jgi:hypothetical protein
MPLISNLPSRQAQGLWSLRQPLRAASSFRQARFVHSYKLPSPFARIDHRAQHADHVEDPGNASLVEGVKVDPVANEFRGNVSLEIGKC